MSDLKMGSRISYLISNRSEKEFSKSKVMESDQSYLGKFFYVNLTLLHRSLDIFKDSKVDLQSIKEVVELALFENSYLFSPDLNQKRRLSIIQNQPSVHAPNYKKLDKYKLSVKNIIEDAENLVNNK